MEEKKGYQAWTISDEFWEAIRGEIPQKERDPSKEYKNAPGQGRKPMSARKALEGIGWEWQSLDGCMIKAPLAWSPLGKTQRTEEKMGTKRSVLVDEKGFPLAIVISGGQYA